MSTTIDEQVRKHLAEPPLEFLEKVAKEIGQFLAPHGARMKIELRPDYATAIGHRWGVLFEYTRGHTLTSVRTDHDLSQYLSGLEMGLRLLKEVA